MPFFDYHNVAREAGLSEADLDRLAESIRSQFPNDDMMASLHVLRACKAIRNGGTSLEEVLSHQETARVIR